jgi:hypothetical protein
VLDDANPFAVLKNRDYWPAQEAARQADINAADRRPDI